MLSVYYAVGGRFLVGIADALLQPAVNSLITRWFPTSERSYALGLATGGRQLGKEFLLKVILLKVPYSLFLPQEPCVHKLFYLGDGHLFFI